MCLRYEANSTADSECWNQASQEDVTHLTVVMAEGMVIFETVSEHKLDSLFAALPPRGDYPPRRSASKLLDQLEAFVLNSTMMVSAWCLQRLGRASLGQRDLP